MDLSLFVAIFTGIIAGLEICEPKDSVAAMAKSTIIKITDDLDGSDNARTVKFGFEGDLYEIDLNDAHYTEMKDFLAPFIKAGSKLSSARTQRVPSAAKTSREEMQRIRSWAKDNGMAVNDRGRISQVIQDAFHAAH